MNPLTLPTRVIAGIVLGALLSACPFGVGRARAQAPESCAGFYPAKIEPAVERPALMVRTTLLCNDEYSELYSAVSHGPLWAAEHLVRANLEAARQRPREGVFHEEMRLPVEDRAELGDWRGSGFDRGHMVPSADPDTAQAQQQTFSLANMVPQTPALNRGVWAGIEMAVRKLAERDGELFVVTGPAFHGHTIETIGWHKVFVPTSTWKAIYDPATGGAGVYVCKNYQTAPSCAQVSVTMLARVTGIDPFPGLPASVKDIAWSLPPPDPSPWDNESTQARRSGFDRTDAPRDCRRPI